MTELDVRSLTYAFFAAAVVVVYGVILLRRRSAAAAALFLTALAVAGSVLTLTIVGPFAPRGFILSLALGAFFASGLVILSSGRAR